MYARNCLTDRTHNDAVVGAGHLNPAASQHCVYEDKEGARSASGTTAMAAYWKSGSGLQEHVPAQHAAKTGRQARQILQ